VIWSTAAAAAMVTCGLSVAHACSLNKAPIGLHREYYQRFAVFPLFFALSGLGGVVDPSAIPICQTLQKIVEAFMLGRFGLLLFMLLSHESVCSTKGVAVYDVDQRVQSMEVALAAEGSRKHFGGPPLGCFLRPCLRKHDLSINQLWKVMWLVQQYSYAAPVIASVSLILELSMEPAKGKYMVKAIEQVTKCSALTCLYGLFILYSATHHILEKWKTTAKFITVKGLLILFIIQELVLQFVIEPMLLESGSSCFKHAGFMPFWWSVYNAKFLGMWAITLESVLMVVLVRVAFPVEEVTGDVHEFHHEVLENAMSKYEPSDEARYAVWECEVDETDSE